MTAKRQNDVRRRHAVRRPERPSLCLTLPTEPPLGASKQWKPRTDRQIPDIHWFSEREPKKEIFQRNDTNELEFTAKICAKQDHRTGPAAHAKTGCAEAPLLRRLLGESAGNDIDEPMTLLLISEKDSLRFGCLGNPDVPVIRATRVRVKMMDAGVTGTSEAIRIGAPPILSRHTPSNFVLGGPNRTGKIQRKREKHFKMLRGKQQKNRGQKWAGERRGMGVTAWGEHFRPSNLPELAWQGSIGSIPGRRHGRKHQNVWVTETDASADKVSKAATKTDYSQHLKGYSGSKFRFKFDRIWIQISAINWLVMKMPQSLIEDMPGRAGGGGTWAGQCQEGNELALRALESDRVRPDESSIKSEYHQI
ncbi:hypothetical protein C8F04DRAFT_1243208 [Mycena alexandri]|uniref:Uncharacterized protein n=1 Tax=Mycena alexandri TaxID=1745969 RepID=A0AAD6WMZ5_9AGAR|nr:hypothetical protein C8F04DRAFT_1243208 [Mycena alexandri]